MKLIECLAHMPFKDGDSLFFCQSEGQRQFETQQVGGMRGPIQRLPFQPWRLARLRDGVISPITVMGLGASSPSRLFCNPVVTGDAISFIYGRNLWTGQLSRDFVAQPQVVRRNVFTGFMRGNKLAYADLPCATDTAGVIVIAIAGDADRVATPFDMILRLIPHGENEYLITGKIGDRFCTMRLNEAGGFDTVRTVAGEDVYKCCIDGENVIHAVKEGEHFENRYLYQDPVSFSLAG